MKHLLRSRLPAFFATLSLLAPGAAAAPARQQAEALPSAREIVDRYAKVTNLAATLGRTSSMHVRGSFSLPAMGMNGAMEVWSAKPNKRWASMEMGAFGQVLTGYDGTTAWMTQPMMGARILSDAELMQAKLEAAYDSGLKPDSHYESMRTLASQSFEGKECHKVELVARALDGMDAEKTRAARTSVEYYEIATGLLVGSEAWQEGEMGAGPVTTIFSDYKELGGQLQPTKTRMKVSGQEFVLTVDSDEYDTATETTFAPPAEIQKMIEAAAAKPAAGAPKAQ